VGSHLINKEKRVKYGSKEGGRGGRQLVTKLKEEAAWHPCEVEA
jgi:hypothetical protein